MTASKSRHADLLKPQKKGGPRYTPVSRRQDRPDAIAWFVRNHPEVTDAQIAKLLGTTKATIDSVRNRQHWNTQNIKPVDPVTLGLCSQIDLDLEVQPGVEVPDARFDRHGRPLPCWLHDDDAPAAEEVTSHPVTAA